MKLPSWIELHGAITHFPIALLIVAAAAEAASLMASRYETQRRFLQQVGLLMLGLAVVSALPSILTGYLYGRNLRRPGLDYDSHWKVAAISTVLAALVLFWRLMGRDRLKPIARGGASAMLLVATLAVGYTGHLGGQMVFGDDAVEVASASATAPATAPPHLVPIQSPAAPDKMANAAGQMEIAVGKLDVATDHLALAAGAAQAARAERAAQQSVASAERAEAATQKVSAVSSSPAPIASGNATQTSQNAATAARMEAIADRYEKVAQKLGLVADHLANLPLQTGIPTTKVATQSPKVPLSKSSIPIAVKSDASKPATIENVAAKAPAAPSLDPQLISTGEKLARSDDLACFSCHKLNGVGGRGGGNLDGTGSRHPDVEWQIAHLKDPKSRVSNSKMPAYNDLTPDQLKAVGTFLAALK